ncbi:hypothetical protein ABKA04_005065 [Annulohypoxylon sp. FPYF3050]
MLRYRSLAPSPSPPKPQVKSETVPQLTYVTSLILTINVRSEDEPRSEASDPVTDYDMGHKMDERPEDEGEYEHQSEDDGNGDITNQQTLQNLINDIFKAVEKIRIENSAKLDSLSRRVEYLEQELYRQQEASRARKRVKFA